MEPARERECDYLLENPLLQTPPPEPEKPRPPWIRRPRVFKMPPRFPLISHQFYTSWCNHRKRLILCTHKVDSKPVPLFPELYLKPQRLDCYAKQLQAIMNVNKELLKEINRIQRTGGVVDCWYHPDKHARLINVMKCRKRQQDLDAIRIHNVFFYSRLLNTTSKQPLAELEADWKLMKEKIILGATLPFVLFSQDRIDRGMHDPLFDKPAHVKKRKRVSLEVWVDGGSKLGKLGVELFDDIVPETCSLFMSLLKGDDHGYAYTNSRIFRVVPGLYCRAGDVVQNNGFGFYLPGGKERPMSAENYNLFHSVPGVLSMVVTKDNEVSGQFNILFKPLPQFDKQHVVFGRIVAGNVITMERISAIGRPYGNTYCNCILKSCGYYKRGVLRHGAPNSHPQFKIIEQKRFISV